MSIRDDIEAEVIHDLQHTYGYTQKEVEEGTFDLDEGYHIHMNNEIKLQYMVDTVFDKMWVSYNRTMLENVEFKL